jgi:hypothetical protein
MENRMPSAEMTRELCRVFGVSGASVDMPIAWDTRSVLLTIAVVDRLGGVVLRPDAVRSIPSFQALLRTVAGLKPMNRAKRVG